MAQRDGPAVVRLFREHVKQHPRARAIALVPRDESRAVKSHISIFFETPTREQHLKSELFARRARVRPDRLWRFGESSKLAGFPASGGERLGRHERQNALEWAERGPSDLQITLNGDAHEIAGPLTVTELLAQLQIDARRVAVEHNLVVLKRERFEETMIHEGDEVEIVNFVGGG
jgi:thiamine biosynthesis protein ThiS